MKENPSQLLFVIAKKSLLRIANSDETRKKKEDNKHALHTELWIQQVLPKRLTL